MEDAEAIQALKEVATRNRNNGALGRYQGWGIVGRTGRDWIRSKGHAKAKSILWRNGIDMCLWSSLSYDSDDDRDYGVKLVRQ